MKAMALRTLALPVALVATVAVASAQQEGARQEAREKKQDSKAAAANTGNAMKDSWITMKVHSQFVPDNALENSDIDVDTKAGVVTLNGTVASEAGRARAVAIAKTTDGVKSVSDRLRIVAAHDSTAAAREAGREAGEKTKDAGRTAADRTKSAANNAKDGSRNVAGTSGRPVTDGWIKSKIAAQYVTESSLDNSDIDVDVTKGTVVLNGAVRTAAAKTRAAAVAKATDGVKTVTNNLKVDPNVK